MERKTLRSKYFEVHGSKAPAFTEQPSLLLNLQSARLIAPSTARTARISPPRSSSQAIGEVLATLPIVGDDTRRENAIWRTLEKSEKTHNGNGDSAGEAGEA